MNLTITLFVLAAFLSTLFGGAVIVKFKKYLPYFFAFTTGGLIAVSFLELLPESLEIANEINFPTRYVMLAVVFSFLFYSLVERFFLTHHIHEHDGHGHIMGPVGAGSLVLHSFLDGAAIGSAFQVSYSAGIVVAFAVISHSFTDGINVVSIMLKNKHKTKNALIFLLMAALAPALGVLATTLIIIPQNILAIILAIFVGEFIYIGAATLLPETRAHHPVGIIAAMSFAIILITILTSIVSH